MNKCYKCSNSPINNGLYFTCFHSLCVRCLKKNISINDLIDLDHFHYVKFICPCQNGLLEISINEYNKQFNQSNANIDKVSQRQRELHNDLNYYPMQIHKLNPFIEKEIQVEFYLKQIETKFRDKVQIEMNNHIKEINIIICLIEQIKNDYLNTMNQLLERGLILFRIFRDVYQNYSPCNTKSNNIKDIQFSLQINPNEEYHYVKEHLLLYHNLNLIKITFDLRNNHLYQTNILHGHLDSIFTLERLDDNMIASGSNDKTIKIWNIKNANCIQELLSHCNSVLALKYLHNGILASGSGDKTIKLWNLNEYQCTNTLIGHNSEVYSLAILQNGNLASGSGDKTIKIWNITTMNCEKTLIGHGRSIFCLCVLSNGYLCSGSVDCIIYLWNWRNETNDSFYYKLIGHEQVVNCLIELDDKRIVSGSSDSTIKVWNSESFECEMTLTICRERILSMIQLTETKLVVCSNHLLNIVDIKNRLLLSSFTGHTQDVYSVIKYHTNCIISCSGDKEIIIWNI